MDRTGNAPVVDARIDLGEELGTPLRPGVVFEVPRRRRFWELASAALFGAAAASTVLWIAKMAATCGLI